MEECLTHNIFRIPGRVVGKDPIINLGYLTILTEVAGHVTTKTTYGKYGPARVKVIEWFFLYGVGRDRR